MEKAKIGLIGLAVMGENLARNIAGKGYKTAVYNRTKSVTESFEEKYGSETLKGFYDLKGFVENIETPRKIILMVKAGKPVDGVISEILPFLSPGDILIDAGNSFYKDTQRRGEELKEKHIHFVGCGVSGGEFGALHGPSIMPGCDKNIYAQLQEIFSSISANDFFGGKCISHIGENGAGHFVKMVHNGIEYAIMQMIAEAYFMLKKIYHMNPKEIHEIFTQYQQGKLKSYLIEISSQIFLQKDEFQNEKYLIDVILDIAGAKGTGKWTSIEGSERGESVSTIVEATASRDISGKKHLRMKLDQMYHFDEVGPTMGKTDFIVSLEKTLYLGMIIAYAQGFALIQKTSTEENWNISLGELSRIWQGGCIIRADMLAFFQKNFTSYTDKEHIFEFEEIQHEILTGIGEYKKCLSIALSHNIGTPALSSGLQYFFSITEGRGNTNLIQAMRDYFGAHTYQRNDREGIFHTNWEEK